MFDLQGFIVTNIVNGVKNGTFTKEYANIMAVNYMVKNVIAQKDVETVSTQIEAWEAEQEALKSQNALNSEDLTEGGEIIEEEETSPEMDELEATEGDSLTEVTEEESEELIDAEDEGEPLV